MGVCPGPRQLAHEEIYGNPAYSRVRTVRTMLYAVKGPGERFSQPYYRARHTVYYGLSRLMQGMRPAKKQREE